MQGCRNGNVVLATLESEVFSLHVLRTLLLMLIHSRHLEAQHTAHHEGSMGFMGGIKRLIYKT